MLWGAGGKHLEAFCLANTHCELFSLQEEGKGREVEGWGLLLPLYNNTIKVAVLTSPIFSPTRC